jgi:hypothetical protein
VTVAYELGYNSLFIDGVWRTSLTKGQVVSESVAKTSDKYTTFNVPVGKPQKLFAVIIDDDMMLLSQMLRQETCSLNFLILTMTMSDT